MKLFITRTLILLAITFPAFAFNTVFLHDAPIAYFTTEDLKIFTDTADRALSHSPNNAKVSWKNPETGAHGVVIPLNTTKEKGVTCRKLKVLNSANGRNAESTHKMCRINNEWKAV